MTKLGGFGVSKLLSPDETIGNVCGNPFMLHLLFGYSKARQINVIYSL
jgi:hypothetical protein